MAKTIRHYYLACEAGWFRRLHPVKIFTSLKDATEYILHHPGMVLLKQTDVGYLHPIRRDDR